MNNHKPDEEAIFKVAREIHAADARASYLEQICVDDTKLYARVISLLRVLDEQPGFLESPAVAIVTIEQSAIEKPGAQIGPYKLLEQIGEGGMGAVYMADQQVPVRRRVALKIIKPGMDTRQVIARFEAERQALALMDHPNIARVLDAGATDVGRPYFVMELVRGVPITEFCDQDNLSVRDRLRLFVQVCRAVQHAHQKGIIHRDLKPSNVLVTLHDGQPVPKVIDFGVAKATNQQLTEKTLFTNFSQMIGTPLYMSPEQAEISSLDVDTRSDIYSLGVLLYELLTGTTPFARDRIREAPYDEIRRIIREEEPPKPSTFIDTLGQTRTAVAARRRIDPDHFAQLLRGDLDWIVMKALEKDRTRRYETASGLARDVEHYLHDEPVEAHSPSALYRFRKFARRNRMAITTAGLVTIALISGTVVSTWQAIRATRAERVAEAERNETERQRAAAEEHFQQARESVNDYFTSVSESKLLDVPGLQPLRKELLDSALSYYQRFIEKYGDNPLLQAELAAAYVRVGSITSSIGSQEQALKSLDLAVASYQGLLRQDPAATAYSEGLASAHHWRGAVLADTARLDDAEASYRRALEIYSTLVGEIPGNAAHQAHLANTLASLGRVQSLLARPAEAEESFRRTLTIYEQLANDFPDASTYQAGIASAHRHIAETQRKVGRMSEAEVSNQRAVELYEKLVRENPTTSEYRAQLAQAFNDLNVVHVETGRLSDAEVSFQRAVEIYEGLVRENPSVSDYRAALAHKYFNFGYVQRLMGRPADAERSYRRAIEIYEQLSQENPAVGDYLQGRGTAFLHLGILHSETEQLDEAERNWYDASHAFRTAVERGYATVDVYSGWGDALALLGKWQDAAEIFAHTISLSDHAWKPLYQLALLQLVTGDEAGYRATCADFIKRHGSKADLTVAAGITMACMAGRDSVDDMTTLLEIAQRVAAIDPRNPVFQTLFGAVQYRAGQTNEAIATLKKALPIHAFAELAAPKKLDQIRISRLTGETILTLAYRDVNDRAAYAAQRESLSRLVEKLESHAPQHSEGIGKWALPCAIQLTKQQLARLDATADTNN
jgi:serine/threonine protein kinase